MSLAGWPGDPPPIEESQVRALIEYLYAEQHAMLHELREAITRDDPLGLFQLELARMYPLMATHLRELYDVDDPLWPRE